MEEIAARLPHQESIVHAVEGCADEGGQVTEIDAIITGISQHANSMPHVGGDVREVENRLNRDVRDTSDESETLPLAVAFADSATSVVREEALGVDFVIRTVGSNTATTVAEGHASAAKLDAHFVDWIKRDPYLVLHRSIYFFGMGANAAYYPFAVQLWSSPDGAGLDVRSCGAVLACGHIAAMLAAPVLSSLADRSESWRRTMLLTSLIGQALAVLAMSQAHTFVDVVLTQVVIEAIASPAWSGIDAATQRLLEVTRGSTAEYGNTRAFGALGWGCFAWIFGAAFDEWGMHQLAFGLFAATALPAVVLVVWLPLEKRPATSEGRATALRALLRGDVLVVLVTVLICAMLLQTVDVYRFPFLRSIGASNALLGGSLAMTAASEAPFFFVTSWILARVTLRAALVTVLGTYALRFVFYSMIGEPPFEDPAWTLPAELLHGFTFALAWAASTQYVAVLLPPELSSSAQGLLAALQWGLGSAAGGAASGAIAQAWGWRAMWRAGAGLALLGTWLMYACGSGDPSRR